ncbi:uncharacterized protein LOC129919208 [Episyrphus balteatus]|uniref:uncharacterized protein LOC129919208 n=1 Tax=Episyrphus balteatus TaxID=286459 RepID=UPI002484FC64|nr:uncharacterized protein LOC129919208 [Episyrphus balteatus]
MLSAFLSIFLFFTIFVIVSWSNVKAAVKGDPYYHCQLKSNVTNDQIKILLDENIELIEGIHEIQCFIQCILKITGIMDEHDLRSLAAAKWNGAGAEELEQAYFNCIDYNNDMKDACKSGFFLFKCLKGIFGTQ